MQLSRCLNMKMTFAEKLLAQYSGNKNVIPGQIVTVHPDHLVTHDNTAAIIQKIKDEIESYGVCSKSLMIIVLDHVIPAASEKTASNHKIIRDFVRSNKIDNFFDIGHGICHQVVVEKGFALPGKLLLGSDSHTCTYGALGAASTGVGSTDVAVAMATGKLWFMVPRTLKFIYKGNLNPWITGKDLILFTIE